MRNYLFIITILLISCTPTEPTEIHDDIYVLQEFINNSPNLSPSLDTDSSGIIEPLELGEQDWDNGRITKLHCYNIGLSGGIPESIGKLTQLQRLVLKSNNLGGTIPESIGELTNLTQLNLGYDSLSGNIPESIGNLKKLQNLDLSHNNLVGKIPPSIGNLPILHTFLSDSNNLSGTIPDEICSIYNSNFDLSGNNFCPPLPVCLDKPDEIGFQNCDTTCGSANTYLDGYCYSQKDLNVLQTIIDSSDSLNMNMDSDSNGVVHLFELGFQEWQAGRLEILDCLQDSCNLSTEIPSNIGNLDSLKILNFQTNNLSGKIPSGLGNLSVLEYLYLQDNNLTGEIPEEINSLSKLIILNVKNNKIGCNEFDFLKDECTSHCNDIDGCSGYVSEAICNFETIGNFDLRNNMICPCYPECISETQIANQDITSCVYCNKDDTQICGNLPESVTINEGDSLCFNTDNLAVLEAFIDSSLATLPDSLDISMLSDITGSIEDIKHLELGEQTWANSKLITFDARNRGLSGVIPQNIANLDSLYIFIISNNHLSGELPNSIYTMTNLYSLHLSDNQFSGEISPDICNITAISENTIGLHWDSTGVSQSKSYLYNNNFCPGSAYPDCIELYVGEQDTIGCATNK